MVVVTGVMWLATPPAGRGKTARDLGIDLVDQGPRTKHQGPKRPDNGWNTRRS
jgi:hypothetical protein